MRDLPSFLRWAILLFLSVVLIWLIGLIRLPAAPMLGAMIAAIIVSSNEGQVALPRPLLLIAQAFIGCLMARAITLAILKTMFAHWPVFLATTLSVIALCSALGLVMARWQVLPGTTAIWGSSPGASTVMVLMAEGFGGDIRLVAFMQFLRMMMVAAVGSVVARLWIAHGQAAAVATDWFAAIPPAPFAATVAVALVCAAIGARMKVPGGPVLITLVCATVLSVPGFLVITLPPPLMVCCYAVIGWFIGLRFTREIVAYTARKLPRIVGAIVALIALCGGLAYGLHLVMGIDVLTAYFATSPGGADSVAIIAASSQVDLPFVMAMQVARFVTVLAVGPAVARLSVRWCGQAVQPVPP